jgi:hypothetical protein
MNNTQLTHSSDDTLVPTVVLYRIVFRSEGRRSRKDDGIEHVIARSFADASVVAKPIADERGLVISSIESLGPVHVSAEAKIKIESN